MKTTIILTKKQAKMLLKALSTSLKGHSIKMSVKDADSIIGDKKAK